LGPHFISNPWQFSNLQFGSSTQGSSQVRKHLFFNSHQLYPAETRQPWASLSPPTIGGLVVVVVEILQASSQVRRHLFLI